LSNTKRDGPKWPSTNMFGRKKKSRVEQMRPQKMRSPPRKLDKRTEKTKNTSPKKGHLLGSGPPDEDLVKNNKSGIGKKNVKGTCFAVKFH